MSPGGVTARVRDAWWWQVGLLSAGWLAGEALARLTHLPLPGGVLGLGLVLALLGLGLVPLGSVKRGADWLLAQLTLFFLPATVAVVDHAELLGTLAVKVSLVIVGSTLCVMAVTALTVELLGRREQGPR